MTNEVRSILSTCDVQRCHAAMNDPVDVSAFGEEIFRHLSLATVTRAPEGARDHISGRRLAAFEVRLHAVHQSKRGGIAECGAGAPLDEATGGIPLPESTRVREWRTTADDAAGGFDVGTCLDECVDRRDVVAAGRPM